MWHHDRGKGCVYMCMGHQVERGGIKDDSLGYPYTHFPLQIPKLQEIPEPYFQATKAS